MVTSMRPGKHPAWIPSLLACGVLLMPVPMWTIAAGTVDGSQRQGPVSGKRGTNPNATTGVQPVFDVRLGPGGTLAGLVRDESGRPRPNALVVVSRERQVVARVRTDAGGTYRIAGLGNGVYRVLVDRRVHACRFWSSTTAPPRAHERFDIDTGRIVARGQAAEDGDRNETVHRFGLDGVGGLDPFELTLLATSITSLTLSTVMLSKISQLQDTMDQLPGSP